MNYKIVDYKSEYCTDVSDIVTRNLLEINSKDYGIEKMQKHALEFTPEKIEEYAQKDKTFVALDGENVVGTLRVASDWYGGKDDYVLLTIFVLPEYHGKGIGRMLVEAGENYIKSVKGNKITIPSSVVAHSFYHKLGYEYVDGMEPNADDVILMNKQIYRG